MHPKLLESTIQQCRDYMTAGDCHGEAPPIERLIEAVTILARAERPSQEWYARKIAETERLDDNLPSSSTAHGVQQPDGAKHE